MKQTFQQLIEELEKVHVDNIQWISMASTLLMLASKTAEPSLRETIDDFLSIKNKQ